MHLTAHRNGRKSGLIPRLRRLTCRTSVLVRAIRLMGDFRQRGLRAHQSLKWAPIAQPDSMPHVGLYGACNPALGVTWDIQTLFRGHGRRVTRSLIRRGVAADVAEDLTQDVFLRILEKNRHQTMAQAGADPAPLLFRIARNLLIDQWRREKAQPQVPLLPGDLDMIADPAPLTEQRIYDRQRLELTARALMAMPERTRRAFELHRIEGRTIAEVSAELSVSTSRGWALIHDAYRRIRQTLSEG